MLQTSPLLDCISQSNINYLHKSKVQIGLKKYIDLIFRSMKLNECPTTIFNNSNLDHTRLLSLFTWGGKHLYYVFRSKHLKVTFESEDIFIISNSVKYLKWPIKLFQILSTSHGDRRKISDENPEPTSAKERSNRWDSRYKEQINPQSISPTCEDTLSKSSSQIQPFEHLLLKGAIQHPKHKKELKDPSTKKKTQGRERKCRNQVNERFQNKFTFSELLQKSEFIFKSNVA